jgi:polar amino acid transport system substrate-binding protein
MRWITRLGVAVGSQAAPTSAPSRSAARRSGLPIQISAALIMTSIAAGAPARGDETSVLRLCADPANLPFSSDRPEAPGLYVEIGQTLGHVLGRPVRPVWALTYFGKRAIRTTLLAGQCDAAVGLPDDPDFMGPRIIFSKPLLRVGYALVTPKTAVVAHLDELRGRRVAVQFASTPQNLLAERNDIASVTFREPEDAMRALAAGEVDAAFVWGPVAGYLNKTDLGEKFNVVPVDGPGLQWQAAIGFARGQTALRDEVNRAIDASSQQIEALAAKYGLPTQAPRRFNANDMARWVKLAAMTITQSDTPAESAKPEQTNVQSALPSQTDNSSTKAPDIAEGHDIFNGTCAHCHGPDAVQSERRINLRLMKHRYGDKMDETFRYVVTHGRPEKGMPNWSEVLSSEQFDKILAFLHSVQTD